MRRRRFNYSSPFSKANRQQELTTDEALAVIINKQLNKLAESVCEETYFNSPPINVPEFFIGIVEEETKFMEDNQMGRYGSTNDRIAKVWLDDQRGVLCARFPFQQQVVDDLKTQIPKGKKAWNPSLKIWEFSVETIDTVLHILGSHFTQVVDLTKETPQSQSASECKDTLLSILDEEDRKSIYRLLAKKYHPDVAGHQFNGKMAEINKLFNINK